MEDKEVLKLGVPEYRLCEKKKDCLRSRLEKKTYL